MDTLTLAFALHLIILGYTLGSDFVVDQRTFSLLGATDATPAERSRLLRSILVSDQHPRMGLILFIATGITFESLLGQSPIAADLLPLIWLVAALWLAEIWISFLNEDKPWGHQLVNADVTWRYLVAGLFLFTGLWSLLGDGPFDVSWIAWKYLLLGLLIGGGVSVRFCVRALKKAWPDYLEGGGTPEFEAILNQSLKRAIYITWSIWVIYGVIALLTVVRPGEGAA